MRTGTISNRVVTLIGRVVCFQAVDHVVHNFIANLLICPEHTGCRLFHEYSRNLALFSRNLERSLIVNIYFIKEFYVAVFIDQHEADVGSLTRLKGNCRRCRRCRWLFKCIIYFEHYINRFGNINLNRTFSHTYHSLGFISTTLCSINVSILFQILFAINV